VGPGGDCSDDSDCESGLVCHNAYCTGNGSAQPGDPCEGTVDCTPGSICWNNICLGVGSLRFSLAWQVDTDFDLHVETPDGTHIYYGNRSAGGGQLDVDDCVSGSCKKPGATHVENIVFTDAIASGTYTFWAYNYSNSQSSSFSLEVASGDNVLASQSGTLPAENAESTRFTIVR